MAEQLSLFDIDASKLADGLVEGARPPRRTAAPTTAKTAGNSIVDFGRKIGGARKDLWAERGLALSDLAYMNDDERTAFVRKNSVWPPVKWRQEVDDGCPIALAWLQKRVRDAIPTTPVPVGGEDARSAQERYVRFVSNIRDAVRRRDAVGPASPLPRFLEDEGYVEKEAFGVYRDAGDGAGLVSNGLLRALRDASRPDALAREAKRKGFTLTRAEKEAARWKPLRVVSVKDGPDPSRVALDFGYATLTMARARCEKLGIREGVWILYANKSGVADATFASEEEALAYVAEGEGPRQRGRALRTAASCHQPHQTQGRGLPRT